MSIPADDHQQLSDAYYKEAREQYIGDGTNTLTVTTWLIGFLLIWVQLTIETITIHQKWIVMATLAALFLSIFFSFWTRRKVNEFLNETG